MKKLTAILLVLVIAASFTPAYAAKGASEKAYEHVSEESIFNRMGDFFATIGMSKEEKDAVIAERRAERAKRRAEKEARKAKRKAEAKKKEMKKQAGKSKKKWGL